MPFDLSYNDHRPDRPEDELYAAIVGYYGRDPTEYELRVVIEAICLGIEEGFRRAYARLNVNPPPLPKKRHHCQ